MKELWPLEENKYIFLFYGETLPLLKWGCWKIEGAIL